VRRSTVGAPSEPIWRDVVTDVLGTDRVLRASGATAARRNAARGPSTG
jgi:hypothetical protein